VEGRFAALLLRCGPHPWRRETQQDQTSVRRVSRQTSDKATVIVEALAWEEKASGQSVFKMLADPRHEWWAGLQSEGGKEETRAVRSARLCCGRGSRNGQPCNKRPVCVPTGPGLAQLASCS